jgi:hypothetical protein
MTDNTDHDILIEVKSGLSNLDKKLDAVLTHIQGVEDRLADVEDQGSRHSERIQVLRTDVSGLKQDKLNRTEIENVKEDVEALKTKSNTWDVLNSLGIGLITVLEVIFRR